MLERFVVHTDARCASMQHFQDGLPVCYLLIFVENPQKGGYRTSIRDVMLKKMSQSVTLLLKMRW